MLSLFPLQFLALLAYFLLRVCVGGMLLYFAHVHLRHKKNISKSFSGMWQPYNNAAAHLFIGAELILGVLFIIGLYTQAAALGLMALTILCILLQRHTSVAHLESRLFYLLFFFAALSLFITGAGAFAFDLPI